MIVKKQMECRLAGETEILGENLPSATFVHHKIPTAELGYPKLTQWNRVFIENVRETQSEYLHVGFKVLTTVITGSSILWGKTSCRLLKVAWNLDYKELYPRR
jgi:hypothetical protein